MFPPFFIMLKNDKKNKESDIFGFSLYVTAPSSVSETEGKALVLPYLLFNHGYQRNTLKGPISTD